MSQENINLINKIYDAFNSRKYETVLESFNPDFEWVSADSSPLADRSPYHGIQEVREGVFGRIDAMTEKLTVNVDEIFAADNKVVVLGYYDTVYRGGAGAPPTQVAHIWTVTGTRAAKFQQYVDTLKIYQSTHG